MKIISIFCIILCVTSFVNALDDSLYMYFDLEGILEGYETRLPIMEKGKFNSQVANFANSIAIPANVSQCSLIWFTIPNAGTTYKATVIANEPEKLGVLLSEPVKGIVSDHEKKFYIYFTCHELGTFKMMLKLQFFNKDYTQEYEGFEIYPSHICEKVDYDPCTYYHDSIKTTKRNAYVFSSINLQPSELKPLDRFKEAYSKLVGDSIVLSVQGVPPEIRQNITDAVVGAYKYRIPYPHIQGKEDSAPLYLMSKNPIYTCNYIEFDENHEYGAVIAGIAMSDNRIAFIVNAAFPQLNGEADLMDEVIQKLSSEIKSAVDKFMNDHKGYYVDGYFFGDVNFETDIEQTHMDKLNRTIGEIIGNNQPASDLVIAYKEKTANTTVTYFRTRMYNYYIVNINNRIGTDNYTYGDDDNTFLGAVRGGALELKIGWGQDGNDDGTTDSASSIFNLMCLLLVLLSMLLII